MVQSKGFTLNALSAGLMFDKSQTPAVFERSIILPLRTGFVKQNLSESEKNT